MSTANPTAKPPSKPSKLKQTRDRAHDVLRTESHPLDAIFAPRAVAMIGASEKPGSVGRAVVGSLVSSPFGGRCTR